MSLDFLLKDIKNCKEVCYYTDENDGEEKLTGKCHLLVWGTMMVHMGSITKKNITEWLVRLRIVEQAFGGLGRICVKCEEGEESDGSDGYRMIDWKPTREELEVFVGLKTNVHQLTRAAFKKVVIKGLERDAETAVRWADERVAKAKAKEEAA